MISFIRGKKIHIDPAKIIIDVNGIGYDVNISLRTYSKLKDKSELDTLMNKEEYDKFAKETSA